MKPMKPWIFALALMSPLSLWADSRAPFSPDTWNLVENSLQFNVQIIMNQMGEGDEPIPSTAFVTLELYQGNYYKLSIISRAKEGYSLPHFLPDPPVHSPPPSSRAISGFGYYTIQSDILRFNAHYIRLFADGEDLEEIVRASNDTRVLNEYRIVISFINAIFLDLFNDLYAYMSGGRLVFILPTHSVFAAAAWDSEDRIVWELQRSGGPPSLSRTVVQATVLGDEVAGLTVEFARSIAGRATDYVWRGTTGEASQVDLDISTLDRFGVTGYYSARARNKTGTIIGQWHSIPLNEDRRQVLELPLQNSARVVASHPLSAAKVVAPVVEQPEAGLAPNFPNPFNGSTLIAYQLADPGPVRLEIYNSLGQHLRTLVDDVQAAGRYVVRWDARDQRGADVAAGVYLMRLFHPGGIDIKPMLYLK